jgi:hypothetical protein
MFYFKDLRYTVFISALHSSRSILILIYLLYNKCNYIQKKTKKKTKNENKKKNQNKKNKKTKKKQKKKQKKQKK